MLRLRNDRGWVTFIRDSGGRIVAEVSHHPGSGISDGVDRITLRGAMTSDELREIADWVDGKPLGISTTSILTSLLKRSEPASERFKALALAIAVAQSPAGFKRADKATKLSMVREAYARVRTR